MSETVLGIIAITVGLFIYSIPCAIGAMIIVWVMS